MTSVPIHRRVASIPTEAVLRLAVWGAFFVVLSFTSADPDLWGHIRFGLDILRDGYVHHIDTYSFASDRPWVNHEWGAEVLSALDQLAAWLSGERNTPPDWPGYEALAPALSRKSRHGAILLPLRALVAALDAV